MLRERLALILLYKCADPRLKELTLTEVEMSPDLKQAKVFYVARENLFRLMPEFIFLPDPGLDRAAKLEKLFQAAKMGPGTGGDSET